METIRGAVSSLTGYGAQPNEGDVAAQTAAPPQDPEITDRDPDEMPSNQEGLKEPKNLVTREDGGEDNSNPDRGGDSIPAEPKASDPAVVEDKAKSLTGSGADGSHSAVFGLTPDGHTHDDTAHGQGSLKPAHSETVDNTESKTNEDS